MPIDLNLSLDFKVSILLYHPNKFLAGSSLPDGFETGALLETGVQTGI